MIFKRPDNAGVELQASTPQQCAVGGVLHQCVLEGVFRIGRSATLEDQFGGH
jgi:hypothetical protein